MNFLLGRVSRHQNLIKNKLIWKFDSYSDEVGLMLVDIVGSKQCLHLFYGFLCLIMCEVVRDERGNLLVFLFR